MILPFFAHKLRFTIFYEQKFLKKLFFKPEHQDDKRFIKAKKKQRHATNEKPNMYINIFNKKNQYFDSNYKSSSGSIVFFGFANYSL